MGCRCGGRWCPGPGFGHGHDGIGGAGRGAVGGGGWGAMGGGGSGAWGSKAGRGDLRLPYGCPQVGAGRAWP